MQHLLLALAALACARAPDPLAEQRATCEQLYSQKALRAGLSVEECAKDLKARADLADPDRRASELIERVGRLIGAGKDKPSPGQQDELRDSLLALQGLGRPAAAPTLAKMKAATDKDLRIALAKVLVNVCAEDCAGGRYDCIVPALLEGISEDKPSPVRLQAERGLQRCTREELGDDPAAWRAWWAARLGEKDVQAAVGR